MIITCFIIVHYLIGYILLISSNLHIFMGRGIEKSIKADFLLSYFITSVYLVFILLFTDKISKYAISGFIGIGTCYLLNLKILFTILKDPKSIKICEEDKGSFGRLLTAVILILIMIVSNLYLGVVLADSLQLNAFSNNPSNFDLFYYTIVTFTTIGFGDIIPLTIPAKLMAIIISITSVICITVFLGSIFSHRRNKV
ncbi:MAG TPA: ion channel [Clostridium sp.]